MTRKWRINGDMWGAIVDIRTTSGLLGVTSEASRPETSTSASNAPVCALNFLEIYDFNSSGGIEIVLV